MEATKMSHSAMLRLVVVGPNCIQEIQLVPFNQLQLASQRDFGKVKTTLQIIAAPIDDIDHVFADFWRPEFSCRADSSLLSYKHLAETKNKTWILLSMLLSQI